MFKYPEVNGKVKVVKKNLDLISEACCTAVALLWMISDESVVQFSVLRPAQLCPAGHQPT